MGTLVLCFVTHFLVDLSGIFFMYSVMMPLASSHEQMLSWVILYNFMAFAFPAAAGALADRFVKKRNLLLSASGCLLIACAYLLPRSLTLPPVFLVGLGNGIFHLGAGKEILLESGNKYAPSGVFISSGTMGVFLGTFLGGRFMPLWDAFTLIMLGCFAALVLWSRMPGGEREKKRAFVQKEDGPQLLPILFLFLVVLIRSYYGVMQKYSWKNTVFMSFVFTLCVMGGKFLGGILADWLGLKKTVWLSLGIAGAAAVFSMSDPVMGCISIFFFNMTMPLTLSLMASKIPSHQGFAFGFLMLALFLGTLPTMLAGFYWFFSPAGMAALCAASLVLLLFASTN